MFSGGHMTAPKPLITLRKRNAKALKKQVLSCIQKLQDAGETLTVNRVAREAGVSRTYLYKTPELLTAIRKCSPRQDAILALCTRLQQELAIERQRNQRLRWKNVALRNELEILKKRREPV